MDAATWDQRYAASEMVWSVGPNQFVAAECADLAPGRAVDLACGEGRNALWLASRGWRVTALDFSTVAVDRGRSLPGGDAVDWLVADATRWERGPDEDPYDLALLCYLQLPADERREAVNRAFAAIAPGGTLLVVAHDSSNLTDGTGGPQDPAVLMTAADVEGDLAGLPVDVERAERVAREVPVDDPHGGTERRTAWDCLVRARRTH